jgi:rubrerythrin
MSDLPLDPPTGLSVYESDLYRHLVGHVHTERGMLEEYSAIADKTGSKAFKYVVGLLIEDEIRHHRLFMELARSLTPGALVSDEDPPVPYMDFHLADRAAILEGTAKLLEGERDDIGELKRLQKELREVKETSLWGLLVELMERDTQKHIAILKFIEKHTK